MDADDLDFGQTLRGFAEDQIVFGRFRFKSLLGRGGMGVVWLGWDEKLDEQVALKFMPENVRMDEAAIHDLKRETRKSRQLTHPSIVRIHDFFESDETAAIAMEYVDGHTLSSLRLQKPHQIFQPSELEAWIRQLGAALSYAHGTEKVVHRDLKPSNLMVNSRGQLKVTDFGISSTITDSMSRVSMANLSSGSPPYMSPQQLNGQAPSASDDIYSLGATLYELLTGKPPFYRGNIAHQVLEVPARPVSEQRTELTGGQAGLETIPHHWESGIARCLAKTPEERPRTVEEAVSEILGESAPVTAKVTKSDFLPSGLNKWKGKGPLIAGALVLLFVLVALAGVVIYKVTSSKAQKYEVKPDLVVQSTLPVPNPQARPSVTAPSVRADEVKPDPTSTPQATSAEQINPLLAGAASEDAKQAASIIPVQLEMVNKIWTRMFMKLEKNSKQPVILIGFKQVMNGASMMDLSTEWKPLNCMWCNLSDLPDKSVEELGDAPRGSWIIVTGQLVAFRTLKIQNAKILSPSEMDQAIGEAAAFYNLEYKGHNPTANNSQNSGAATSSNSNQADIETGRSLLEQAFVSEDNIKADALKIQAYPYFKKAADQGNAEALRRVGNYYRKGIAPENKGAPDLTTALNYYIQAAEKGDAEAAYRVSQAYLRGDGVDANWGNFMKYNELAYNLNSSDAKLYAAECFSNGEGPAYNNGIIQIKVKFPNDNKKAYFNLNDVISRGSVPHDPHENENYFRALFQLGNMYYNGQILTDNGQPLIKMHAQPERADYKKAYEYYKQAMEGGSISAKYTTGICLLFGHGINIDRETGKKYINEAANKGVPQALEFLGKNPEFKISEKTPTKTDPTSTTNQSPTPTTNSIQ